MPETHEEILKDARIKESQALIGEKNVEVLKRLIEDAIDVLEETGFHCPNGRIKELLESTGLAAYDETSGQMHILGDLSRQVLKQVPKNESFPLPFGSFGIGGTAPYFLGEGGSLEDATEERIEQLAKIAEQSEEVSFLGRGVKLDGANDRAIEILSSKCRKPFYCGVDSKKDLDVVERLRSAGSPIYVVWDILQSPLSLSDHMVDMFLETVDRRIPIFLASMPMPAVTAPYSVSGLLIMALAEFIAGLAIVQIRSEGCPVVCSSFPTMTDIKRRYSLDFGHPCHNFVNCFMSHIARLLDIPACQSGCTTNEKDLSPRAIEDAKLGYSIFKKYGAHLIRHAFGFNKDLIAFSFEKFEKAREAFASVDGSEAPELLQIEYDEEAREVIARNGSSANYMQDEHTVQKTGKGFIAP